MTHALIVSKDKGVFFETENVFAQNGITSEWGDTGSAALAMLSEKKYDLLVVDEKLPDMVGRDFIERVVMKHPMINCVVSSPLGKKEFHQVYEGLGVLMQFTPMPGKEEVLELMEHMNRILQLQKKI